MKPINFPETNVTFAKDQPEYEPLPAFTDERETISCWQLTWRERWRVLIGGRLWLRQMNQGQPLQPQLIQVEPVRFGFAEIPEAVEAVCRELFYTSECPIDERDRELAREALRAAEAARPPKPNQELSDG